MTVLTPREFEILESLALATSSRRIAEALSITERTVKIQVRSLTHKMGVSDRSSDVWREFGVDAS